MKRPRIYSDFNGPFQPTHMLLSYIGTLTDLNFQKITPAEGLLVTVYSDSDEVEDIEIDGVVCYGPLPDPTWPDCWYVCTDAKSFRFVHVKRENEEDRRHEIGEMLDGASHGFSAWRVCLNILSIRSVIKKPLTILVIEANRAIAPMMRIDLG